MKTRCVRSLELLVGALLLPLGGVRAQAPAAGAEWTTPAGTVQGTRFSSLNQITTANVSQLQEEFQFNTRVVDGFEGTPLVVGSTMYVVSAFPNRLFALDLARGGALKWTFDPRADRFATDKPCCDRVNRGAVFANGKIIYNVMDNTVVAVDAVTGAEVWRTKVGDPRTGQTVTMAPLVVRNNVFIGNSGGEMGVRGFIQALNVDTGAPVWKAFSTGPDADVRIGPRFHPFYAKDRGTNLGSTTWGGDLWQHGGSTVWAWLTYDPVSNLLFHGTANPGVWNPDLRPGDNKWASTVLARDPDTGDAIWAYQYTPHESWDYDGVNESIVADLPIGGVTRHVIVHFDRNGFGYTIDRNTGQVLVAKPYIFLNWATGVDLTTGEPIKNPAKQTHEGVNVKDICPAASGGKDFPPAAFSPRTNLFYSPTNNFCQDYHALKVNFFEGAPFTGVATERFPGPGGNRGTFMAWNAAIGTKVWEIREPFEVWSGALATAGDVVFYGTLDRFFKAVDARTGRLLFQTTFDSGIIGHPMTFLGPDGRQRVAIYSGPKPTQTTPAAGTVHVFKLP
jgi:lanthanide-dependent methanol dehydrogenase